MGDVAATTIDLIRHGEPQGGTKFRGWLDDPLSETGWQQMQQAVAERQGWQQVVSSPLLRCHAFAEHLAQHLSLPLHVEESFKEMGFGEWEGCLPSELQQTQPQRLAAFWSDPIRHPPPGGEALSDVAQRVATAWQSLLERHAGKHVLLVAHGGINRIVISQVLGIPLTHLFRMEIPFAGMSRIVVEGDIPRLVFHNA